MRRSTMILSGAAALTMVATGLAAVPAGASSAPAPRPIAGTQVPVYAGPLGGVPSFVKLLAQNKDPIGDPIQFNEDIQFEHEGQNVVLGVQIALQWTDAYQETILCYTNNIANRDGGTHLTGFRTALTKVVNAYAGESGAL